jgi:hypothetical protein
MVPAAQEISRPVATRSNSRATKLIKLISAKIFSRTIILLPIAVKIKHLPSLSQYTEKLLVNTDICQLIIWNMYVQIKISGAL